MKNIHSSFFLWGIGFGKEISKKHKAKTPKYETPIIKLENFRINGKKAIAIVRNISHYPGVIINAILFKVLNQPKIKKGLLHDNIEIWERSDREIQPKNCIIPPGCAITFRIDLMKTLEINQNYIFEIHMEDYIEHIGGPPNPNEIGFSYLLKFNGKGIEKIATMSLKQARAYWKRLVELVKKNATYKS